MVATNLYWWIWRILVHEFGKHHRQIFWHSSAFVPCLNVARCIRSNYSMAIDLRITFVSRAVYPGQLACTFLWEPQMNCTFYWNFHWNCVDECRSSEILLCVVENLNFPAIIYESDKQSASAAEPIELIRKKVVQMLVTIGSHLLFLGFSISIYCCLCEFVQFYWYRALCPTTKR